MMFYMTDGIKIVPERVSQKRKKLYGSQQNLVDAWEERYGDAPHQTQMSGVERGEKGLSVERLGRLAVLLETNADYLVGNSNDDAPASDLEDQVVFSVHSDTEKKMLGAIGREFLKLNEEDQKLALELIERLSSGNNGKSPRLIE